MQKDSDIFVLDNSLTARLNSTTSLVSIRAGAVPSSVTSLCRLPSPTNLDTLTSAALAARRPL